MSEGVADRWAIGDLYEPYVGRWSRLAAGEFLAWLAIAADARWLEVGCGTGALSEAILDRAAPREVIGVEPSEAFIAFARRRLRDPRIDFRIGDASRLPVEDGGFDAAVAGLVLNFVPEPARALAEMRRAVRPGGTVAVYVWDYAGEMQLMRRFWDAAVALDPAARELDEGRRFPICAPEPLLALFDEAGLTRMDCRAIDIPTLFRDFDDYWSRFSADRGRRRATASRCPTRSGRHCAKSSAPSCHRRPMAAFTSRPAHLPSAEPFRIEKGARAPHRRSHYRLIPEPRDLDPSTALLVTPGPDPRLSG